MDALHRPPPPVLYEFLRETFEKKRGKGKNYIIRARKVNGMSYCELFCFIGIEKMRKRAWQTRIRKACQEAGTYKSFFDPVIASLAGILEKRDEAAEILDEEETDLVVAQTNKSGFTNLVKNPAYTIWDEMNKTALNYWRELGLTPAGLKKINEEVFIKEKAEKNGNSLKLLLMEKKASNG